MAASADGWQPRCAAAARCASAATRCIFHTTVCSRGLETSLLAPGWSAGRAAIHPGYICTVSAMRPSIRPGDGAESRGRLAVEEAERQGADVMLTSTATLEPAYRAFGFRPVREPDEVRLDPHSAHTFHRTWLIRWTIEPTPIVLHSDF